MARLENVQPSAKDFLSRWMSDNALADSRGPAFIDRTVVEILRAAAESGFSVNSISTAAGGDLRMHVKLAIELWTGEEE